MTFSAVIIDASRRPARLALFGATLLGLAAPALAQIPVNTRIAISGNCDSCDMSDRNLTRLSLSGSKFQNSNFTRSNLSGGYLSGSNLSGARFSKSYLVRVQGEDVNFHRAILTDATLTEASLERSNLSESDLRRADMTRGNFSGTDFSKAVISNATARDANFTGANFGLAKMHHVNLESANFNGAALQFAEFGDSNMTGADLTGANFSGADFRHVRGLTQAQLDQGCGTPDTQLPAGRGLSVPYCPQYLQFASTDPSYISMRSPSSDHTLDRTKMSLKIAIGRIDRAVAALPTRGSNAARAELEKSKAELTRLYNSLP